MNSKLKFLLILIIIFSFNLVVVSANDLNGTDIIDSMSNDTISSADGNLDDVTVTNSSADEPKIIEKTTPDIDIKASTIQSRNSLNIYLKNSSGSSLKFMELTAFINEKEYLLKTDSDGIAKLKMDFPAKTYGLKISFKGNDNYNDISKTFSIKVSKSSTKLIHYTNFVKKGSYLYVYLTDQNGDAVAHKKVVLTFNGKKYNKKTNKNGRIGIKIKLSPSKRSIKVKFKGDNQFKASSSSFKFYIVKSKSLKIGNSILLTNGYLRIYLKDSHSVYKKTIVVKIAGKKFAKKTNSEGIVVVKPEVGAKKYIVTAKIGKYKVSKRIECFEGDVKNPLWENISLRNGIPDIDSMPANYVMGDGSATYTLTKSQYLEVIKRDSHCLFLNNKLSKYTFFKTKSHPNLNHIIKRGKWNVIERAINMKIVKKNKINYWPGSIKVSLKGKSYTYPEVRDVQNTAYTCGPTSASVCSQVLRNYVSEKQLARQAGSNSKDGTKCEWIVSALEKNKFNCTYFYKASFDDALDELKKGGCALIFHTRHHYVSILDISKNGKKVLVSNSYGSFNKIPTKWLTVKYMKTKFYVWEDSLIVRLNYDLSDSTKDSVNCFYNSMGTNWNRQNTHQSIGRI